MGFYSRYILPRAVDITCGVRPIARQRDKIVPKASGVVLDVGFGTGRNLPHYDPDRVELVLALEPAPDMWALARNSMAETELPIRLLNAGGEAIPLATGSIDTVVVTYTLCTIPDPVPALREIRRVLKEGGSLLFTEHGEAPDAGVRRWQSRINPIWKRLAGGCNLDRNIPELLIEAGFELPELSAMYIPGIKIASYNYWGRAQ